MQTEKRQRNYGILFLNGMVGSGMWCVVCGVVPQLAKLMFALSHPGWCSGHEVVKRRPLETQNPNPGHQLHTNLLSLI